MHSLVECFLCAHLRSFNALALSPPTADATSAGEPSNNTKMGGVCVHCDCVLATKIANEVERGYLLVIL